MHLLLKMTDKQLQILEVSEKLFAAKGFEGTSVRDISEAAGVNVAMISYYFGSKEKLMHALFEQRTEHLKMKVEALLQDTTLSPLERINGLIDDYIDRILEKQSFHRILICEQIVNKNSFIIEQVRELKLKNHAVISQLIKDGQKKGSFRKNVDVALLMNILVGTVSQLLTGQDFYREVSNMSKLTDEQFHQKIRHRLGETIKSIFKTLLSNEV